MNIQEFLQWKDVANVTRRKLAAAEIARIFLDVETEFEKRCDAEAAITVLLDDPSEKVRYALAEALCSSVNAPQQVISALVHDQYDIASLVIARSPIIFDSDLIARLCTAEERLQIVIANRPHVSNMLARAISSNGCEDACVTLLKNFNADICGVCRSDIVARHITNASIRGALLQDTDLEADLRLKTMKAASKALSSMALFGKRRAGGGAEKIMHDAEQRALVQMAGKTTANDIDVLIDAMRDNGDLTTQFLIRTACYGKMDFLARVLSVLSGQTSRRVTSIFVNERSTQLNALLSNAGFSDVVLPVFANAISLWRDVAQGNLTAGAQEVTRQVMERFEARMPKEHVAANDDIMALLRSVYLDAMRENARKYAVSLAEAA